MKAFTLTLIVVLVGAASTIFWIEAEKEIEILCRMIKPGQSVEEITRLLKTGEHLEFELDGQKLRFQSINNLYSIKCDVDLQNDAEVASVRFEKHINIKLISIITGSMCTLILVIFQILLACGKPLGEYAWGGVHNELPSTLRMASAISATILFIGILSLLSMNYISLISEELSAYVVAGYALMFLLSILGNLASASKKEKLVMTPTSVVLFLCYFTAAYAAL